MPAFPDIADRSATTPGPEGTPVTPVSLAWLPAALRACASGVRPLEAGAGLLIDCGSWLHREDFTSRFITTGTSISDGHTLMASTGWEAAITALNAGELPSGSGGRRMLILAASIAGGIPISLYDTLPGIDHRNASLVVKAIAHATGQTAIAMTRQPREGLRHAPMPPRTRPAIGNVEAST